MSSGSECEDRYEGEEQPNEHEEELQHEQQTGRKMELAREEHSGPQLPEPRLPQEPTYRELFPFTLDYPGPALPPPSGTLVQGKHKAPLYYLGWLIPWEEIEHYLGEVPKDYDLIEHYKYEVLPQRWKSIGGQPDIVEQAYACKQGVDTHTHFQ
ncbi:hypothetical protein F5880DRAFT_1320911 [Lentinula raphanica]|nr:hypothetical protein F5880DRAFT_1320911 [Lentinula raphanica]